MLQILKLIIAIAIDQTDVTSCRLNKVMYSSRRRLTSCH